MSKIKLSIVNLFFSVVALNSVAQELPIPGVSPSKEVPFPHMTPDADTEYKVVFDFVMNDDNLDDPYPMLPLVARYVNTLANLGVPEESRKVSVVLHRGSGLIGVKNDEFKPRHDGKDNPNIELINQLHAAGVTFHLCGQGMISRGLVKDDLLDAIQVDYWALTTLIELGRQGYVQIGG